MIAVVAVALPLVATLVTIGAIGASLLAWHYWGPRKGEWDVPLRLGLADGKTVDESHSSMLVVFRVA
ncbi:hypothetical protein I2485_02605 [Nesterenkonia sp. E16_7]|uniref:hypothetical protein n=1 Tax=unclassified Nesterenkonia TaxID=2629769 RepID=UPI001A91B97E|nr:MULTISPECIES: hypothetical protein [unclassified Nesterenkonia]MBO0594091.1 hypothetical protein [Nesterenkonia sp. E16_10]MBO0597537.1 hypothetical protein [Nesterenkonia sp. E16_7]